MNETEATLDRINRKLGHLEQRLDGMRQEDEDAGIFLNFLAEEIKPGGIVVDEELAKTTPCRCFEYKGKDYCFSTGVFGVLTPEEQEVLCPEKIRVPDERKERYQKFAAAAEEAHKKIEELPPGERLAPWLEEMGKELSKEGIVQGER